MTSISAREALVRCIEHREIFHDEMLDLFRQVMRGEMSPVKVAALAIGLRVKKESVGEIAAMAEIMREFSLKVPVRHPEKLLDIVGTGGDGAQTFNISTTAMFVAAACGAEVAKHGSRSVSSSSGRADVLEALGVNLALSPEQIVHCLESTGLCFMYAPAHHSAMRHVKAVREELGVRTVFNILGPLTNPASAANMMMGVFHSDLVGIQIRVLQRLGLKRALVVWGRDNLDEISLGASTQVGELIDGTVREYDIHPEDFGLRMYASRNFKVSSAEESKEIILDVLDGRSSPASDIVALNAGAALYAAGLAPSTAEGLKRAQRALGDGTAKRKLNDLVSFTRQFA